MPDIDNAAVSSAVAPSTPPPSAGITSQSSGTASEALIKAATAVSSPANPAEGATPASTPAAAVANPDGTTKPAIVAQPAGQPPVGEAPEPRIVAATRNAREKTIQEFGGYQPAQVREGMAIITAIHNDPIGFITQIIKDVQSKGHTIPGFGTPAAQPAAPQSVEGFPEADIETTDGKIKGWSRDSVIKALAFQKQELIGELTPDLQYVRNERERAAQESVKAQTRQEAGEIKAQIEALPYYKENEPAIADKLRQMWADNPQLVKKFGVPAALYHCYNQVLTESVYPKMQQTAEEKVRADFGRKAATSLGSAHPVSSGGDAKAPQLNNSRDLAAHMERLAAQFTS